MIEDIAFTLLKITCFILSSAIAYKVGKLDNERHTKLIKEKKWRNLRIILILACVIGCSAILFKDIATIRENKVFKHPITDKFELDFKIKFKDEALSKLAKEVIAEKEDINGPDFFIFNGSHPYTRYSTGYDLLMSELFNKFKECSLVLNIGEYPRNLTLSHPYAGDLDYYAAFHYNSNTDSFNLMIKNLPCDILKKGKDAGSIQDLKNEAFSLNLNFRSNERQHFEQFELYSLAIWMNSTLYVTLEDFRKNQSIITPKMIKFW